MTYFDDDDDLGDIYVSDIECTRDQIREGLLNGSWTIHHTDPATGVVWFNQTGRDPAPDYGDLDLIAAALISDRPEAEPETVEVPFDITAASWFPELQAGGTIDVPDDLTIRFADPGAGHVQIGGKDD